MNYRHLLYGAVLLAGCHASPEQDTQNPAAPAPAVPATRAAPDSTRSAAPTGRAYTGYHRYQGTVSGQPVTVMLTIGPDSSDSTKTTCQGAYYYGQARGGLLDLLAPGTYQPRQPLRLEESAPDAAPVLGTWQATQPAGPLLSGTWRSPGGRVLPFVLRETYQDAQGRQLAVRYEVLSDEALGPVCQPEPEAEVAEAGADSTGDEAAPAEPPRSAELLRDFLHLLGPDTLRPALASMQCPVPRQRRREARAFVRDEGSCAETSEPVEVVFNDFGLLSLVSYNSRYYYGAPHFNHAASSSTYDLRTGQEVTLPALLRPGADTRLRQLLTRHLLRDPHHDGNATVFRDAYELDGEQVPLPEGVALAYTGLRCVYGEANINAALGYVTLEVPYRELLPLLRPTSPVARMLRERELWRGN